MQLKLYCPFCGRCLGECNSNEDDTNCKVLISKPKRVNKKHFIHNMKCVRCKNEVYILMAFND